MEIRRDDGSVIAVEVVGEQAAPALVLCHGLADSRLAVHQFAPAAGELGLRIVALDRPGIGRTDPHRLRWLAEWVQDATRVLDALDVESAALLGISAGGPFAAACAAALNDRVRSLMLVSPLGLPWWGARGMAPGQRVAVTVARRAPAFGGWFLGRLAMLAARSPRLFLRVVASELPGVDRRALQQPSLRDAFLASYLEAFHRGSWGVAQDLRVLMRPWGFDLGSIGVPTVIHHGDADTTVPPQHGQLFAQAIPGARLRIHRGHGHFSIISNARDMLATLAT